MKRSFFGGFLCSTVLGALAACGVERAPHAPLASSAAIASGTSVAPVTAAQAATPDASAFAPCSAPRAQIVNVYLIGDSTMSVYTSDRYPRMGWGQTLGESFDPRCATVVDKAISGRSSKSFYDEGAWTPVKDALRDGDYVLIQFGHNDEKSADPARYTEPQTTYKQYLTQYVNDTREKHATPLLLTSIQRNQWSGTVLADTHGAYPPAVRELAQSLHVELIDLSALSKAYFERIGPAETTKLFMNLAAGQFPGYPNGSDDNTHLQEAGARAIGRLALADAYRQKLTLARYLKANFCSGSFPQCAAPLEARPAP